MVKNWFMLSVTTYSVQANEDVLLMELPIERVGSVVLLAATFISIDPELTDWFALIIAL